MESKKKTLKEWWSERSKNQKYLIISGLVALFIIGNLTNNKKTSSGSSYTSGSSSSEAVSKKAYRAGYTDGELNYGDPSAPSYKYFLENHPEITGADVYVYKMGYEDAILGKSKQY
jgi:hypothetical protein